MLPLFFFGFISGIAVASFLKIKLSLVIFCGLLTFLLFLFRKKTIFAFAAIAMLGLTLGLLRTEVSNLYAKSQLENLVGQNNSLTGIIVDEPDVREKDIQLTVKVSGTGEKVLLFAPLNSVTNYGDKISFETVLKQPTGIASPDGRVFDYENYLKAKGIFYTGSAKNITVLDSQHGSVIKSALFKIKNAFVSSLNKVLPQPESSLMAGLLLGAKQSLGQTLLSEFQRAGVSHIVVLSGYNIAIVAKSIMSILSFLPKNSSFGIGALSITLFTILSGGGASAWRGALMVMAALFAEKSNRQFKAPQVFGLTVFVMLVWNPMFLIFDPSFQLTALAMIGLIFVSPKIAPYFSKVPEKFGLREIISSTVATQIVVLPYLIYSTGLISLVALPVNILILGTIPVTMFFGFLTGAIGLISTTLSLVPAFFSYILLRYQFFIINSGASLPALTLPTFSPWILILVYAVIFIIFKNKSGGQLQAATNFSHRD